MKKTISRSIVFVLILMMQSLYIQAQNLTDAREIADKCDQVFKYAGDDGIATATMDIRNAEGKTVMNRELIVMRKNVSGSLKQKWYTYFKKPADIRKMVFLAHKNPEKDDDRWIYLPAMDLVKRLAGSDKRSSFAGSQFVYEDITGRSPALENHELISSEGVYYEVKSTPKDQGDVEFAYYVTYIQKSNFLPMVRIFYDKNDIELREFNAEKVETIQGFPSIVKFSMTDAQTGDSTLISYSKIKYNVGIEDEIFTESYLKRSPRKWLRYK